MQRNKRNMDDETRLRIANRFADDWLEPMDDNPHDMPEGYPRLACDRRLFVLALVALIEDIEVRTQQDASGGPVVDLETICRMCVGDGTT